MNRCKFCGRPVALDEDGWLIRWDRKRSWVQAWFECPDHTFEQLALF